MTLTALRDDALSTTARGFVLRLGLPWIRSLPLSSITDLEVVIDGVLVSGVTIQLDARAITPEGLADEFGWWFLQDRLNVAGPLVLTSGSHDVAVMFRLTVPYLQTGPDGPLSLPFVIARSLTTDTPPPPPAIVRETPAPASAGTLPAGWTLAGSAFNWTPEVIRADRSAPDIALGIVADGVASVIEIEPGQLWPSFPEPSDAEADAFREALGALGGSVSIVGASLDDWASPTRRRTDDERIAFLMPQLRSARRVGAAGVRLPIGQAGEPLLRRLLPSLAELDLVLFEEIQGQQTPENPAASAALDTIAAIDDPRLRVLVDISMLMPSLPPSYLARLRSGGVSPALLDRLATDWRDPSTNAAVVDLLRSGSVPAAVHTLFMNLLVRFGRSQASDLRGILPLVGGFHLKFWDLDDSDDRVSRPIRDVAQEIAGTSFEGTLCSEWGGHEWVDEDPSTITRAHLALAHTALVAGARTETRNSRPRF